MVEDIFSEIDGEERAAYAAARNRRLALVGLGLLLLAGIVLGGWQYLAWRRHERAAAAAPAFFEAQKNADIAAPPSAGPDAALTPEQQRARSGFAAVAAGGPEGFATLSRLRLAALDWQAGDRDGALALWDRVGRDAAADPDLRGLGDLLWVQHRAGDADPGLLKARLRDILKPDSPWRLLATEADALIDLRLGRQDEARRKLTAVSEDPAASQSERARAGGLLDTLDPSKSGG